MFDFLNELPLSQLTSGVHFAIRRLSHPAFLPFGEDVTPSDHEVAERVFQEIDEVEKGHWKPDDRVTSKYIHMLSETVLSRTRHELGADPERGRMLLERLRESFSEGWMINLNTATETDLESLPGVGPVTARKIIAGKPYRSVDDLMHVDGIGEEKMAALRQHVTVR